MPFKVYVFFLIPIAVDGLTQMVGLRESNWVLRTVTGALFGFATVFFAYPFVDEAMQEVLDSELGRQAGGGGNGAGNRSVGAPLLSRIKTTRTPTQIRQAGLPTI